MTAAGDLMTREQIDRLPNVYRDFMRVLRPVVTTRNSDSVLRITGIPFGMIYEAISTDYGYNLDQVRELAANLRRRGLVQEDKFGFFVPTGIGEELIRTLNEEDSTNIVPPLPDLDS